MTGKRKSLLIWSIFLLLAFSIAFEGFKSRLFGLQKYDYYAFIPNTGDGTISVIDTKNNEIARKIDVGETLSDGIAVSKDGRFIYTGDAKGGNVYVIDTYTGEKMKEIKTGLNVHGIDMTPDGKYLYVASGDLKDGKEYDYVSIIDISKNEVIGQITSDWKSPSHIDFSKNGDFAYISNVMSNEVAIVDTRTRKILKRIPVGSIPNETEPSIDGKRLYVANVGDGTLSVIDLVNKKVVDVINTGKGTHGVAVSPDNKYVWTANRTSNNVAIVDIESDKVVKTIDVGGTPNHISFVPDKNIVYVSDLDSGDIAVIDAKTYKIINRIPTGKEPHVIVFAAAKDSI